MVYGQAPPIHLPFLPGEAANPFVERTLSKREAVMQLLKFHVFRSQNRMSQQANKHRSDRDFNTWDYVYLKLQPYKQLTIRHNSYHKLLPKYYRRFKVLGIIGSVVYQLELPSDSEIHNVFHVSQLKL